MPVQSLGGENPWSRKQQPIQYCCLENPMDRGAWQATVLRVEESDMTEVTSHTHVDPEQQFSNFLDLFDNILPFSRGSSQPWDQTQVSRIAGRLPPEPQGKPKNTGVGSLSLLQWIFPTQESNWDLLHYRQILYQLSYQGSPDIVYTYTASLSRHLTLLSFATFSLFP